MSWDGMRATGLKDTPQVTNPLGDRQFLGTDVWVAQNPQASCSKTENYGAVGGSRSPRTSLPPRKGGAGTH